MKRRRKPLFAGALVSVMLATAVMLSDQGRGPLGAIEFSELRLLDYWFRLRGPTPTSDDLVIVTFDDQTMTAHPELFERRTGLAAVIEALDDAGAAVIGLDLFLTDPEHTLSSDLTTRIEDYVAGPARDNEPDTLLRRVHQETQGDATLVRAMETADNVVLAMHVGKRGDTEVDPRSVVKGTFGQSAPGDYYPSSDQAIIASDPMFHLVSKRLGVITTWEDRTGSVRQIPIATRRGNSLYVPFAAQLVAERRDVSRAATAFLGEEGAIYLGSDQVAQSTLGRLLLNWGGPARFDTISAADLVYGEVEPDRIRGRIALVGYTHLGHDSIGTPFGRRPGVEAQATAAQNMIDQESLRRLQTRWEALLALALGLTTALLFRTGVTHVARLAVIVAIPVTAYLVGFTLFTVYAWHVPAMGMAVTGFLSGLAALTIAYRDEGLERRQLRSAFDRYLSAELVEELVSDPSRLSLQGERRTLSILFSDVRGFTSISEQLTPMQLVEFLNACHGPMTRAVVSHRGYVDKLIGDALMAFWGAPVPSDTHATDACRTAMAMHHAIQTLAGDPSLHRQPLQIGIGINTGEVVVGNIGSSIRFDYTVVGDAVNLASRLESLTKYYGVFCLVGPETVTAAPEFSYRWVDRVRVKGRDDPADIFQLCGGPDQRIATYRSLKLYDRGVQAWRTGDLGVARESWRAFLAQNNDDLVVQHLLERLSSLGDVAPTGWDGVNNFTHK